MEMLQKYLMYIHPLFTFFLFFIGVFVTVIALEYRLKNPNLKHTIAAFLSVVVSGIAAYIVPVMVLSSQTPFAMQAVGIASAFVAQAIFWLAWFRKQFKDVAIALLIAFVITVIIAVPLYSWTIGYINEVAAKLVPGFAKVLGGVTSKFLKIIPFF